jgi:stage II sporulation protein D
MKSIVIMLTAALSLSPLAAPLSSKAVELPTDEAQKNKPATIKVLLHERKESLLLEVKGSYKVFCPHTNVLLFSGFSPKRGFIHSEENGLYWSESLPGTHSVRIVPSHQSSIFVNGIQYNGCVEIYDLGGSLRVINEVDIESYLRSCLATKCFEITEPEVLNALAIVTRTQSYFLVQRESKAPWHISAQDAHYRGYGTTLQNPQLERAITETRHAILTYQNKPFATAWTEDSAGKTASFSSVFRKNTPSPKGVTIDGMESERLRSAWSFQIAKAELANLAKLATVSRLSTFSEKESGKVYAVRLGTEENMKTVDFFTLQKILGTSKLRSNDFTVEVLENTIRFKGYGKGPGVGLCLHSADLMAKQKLNAQEILEKFYPEASLEKVTSFQRTEKTK